MTLTAEDLNSIRDEIDEALEDALDDKLSDLNELASQVEWSRRDLDLHMKDLKGHTRLEFLLCERFLKLSETLKREKK